MDMDMPLTIAVICGTKREGRRSLAPAEWVAVEGRKLEGVEIIFVDPKDFTLPPDGNDDDGEDAAYRDITRRADAFFIVTPEYNRGYPSSLKRLLDSEYANYNHKPVALAGVSNGQWGGTRVVEALLPVMRQLGLVTIRPTLYFPTVQNIFDEFGTMKPEFTGQYEKQVKGAYEELLWFARALKAAQ
jgi:NAD(P)H-dependent FMN reductase